MLFLGLRVPIEWESMANIFQNVKENTMARKITANIYIYCRGRKELKQAKIV